MLTLSKPTSLTSAQVSSNCSSCMATAALQRTQALRQLYLNMWYCPHAVTCLLCEESPAQVSNIRAAATLHFRLCQPSAWEGL